MITQAPLSILKKTQSGIFPVLNSKDVAIKWLTQKDEWIATNATGKTFNMFENGTTLDGSLICHLQN
jgi:hypothetical protein